MRTESKNNLNCQRTKLLKEDINDKESIIHLEGLTRGEKAILEDRTIPHSEAMKRMSRWLN